MMENLTDGTPLLGLTNIGTTIAKRLAEVDIRTVEDLRSIGPAEAFKRVQINNPERVISICYYLYALQGALEDVHWDSLPVETKLQLRLEAGVRSDY